MGGVRVPLSVKERFVAVMASRAWDGKLEKNKPSLLFKSKYVWDPVSRTGHSEFVVRRPSEVRRLLDARRNHIAYSRMRKFVDAAKVVRGFESGLSARLWMDEWRSHGSSWYERMLLFFVDAEDLAEVLSDADMEARLLAEAL